MNTKKKHTITVFSENRAGLLNRVTSIFNRRKVNIDCLTVSESEHWNLFRYTIVVEETEKNVATIVKQLEKQIEIHSAYAEVDDNLIYQEIALYKIETASLTNGCGAEQLIRKHHARVLSVEKDFTVLEKTGHKEETKLLYKELKPFGLKEFVRSGRVAITKPENNSTYQLNEHALAAAIN